MEKDRIQRYQTATVIKADLQQLKKETETGLTWTGPRGMPLHVVTHNFQRSGKQQTYLLLGVSALLITVLAVFGARWFRQRSSQEHNCRAPAAEHQWRFQRGLSAFRSRRTKPSMC